MDILSFGVISIDKIGISQNILDDTSMDALKYAVTRFYGPSINTPR